jgi:periplasmic divalent cation tolerance protein
VSTEICEVIITADNPEWLLDFTRSLVRDRLAACGQHVLSIRSIYRWQGAIEDEREIRVALHTPG